MTIDLSTLSALSDEGAERAILACLMKEPGRMTDCIGRLTSDDFTNENNSYLYGLMTFVYNKNGGKDCKFDITTLHTLAKEKGAEEKFIQKSGGKEYIEFLDIVKNSFIDIVNFPNYINTILSLSGKRKLYINAEEFKVKILDPDRSPEELIIAEQNSIDNLFENISTNISKVDNISKTSDIYLTNVLKVKKEIIGIRTMYTELDKCLEGLRRGTLSIISAPRKTGKSAFLMNIGINTGIKQRIPTLMISTEMSDEEILSRMISNLSRVQEKKIKKGDVTQEEYNRIKNANLELKKGKFFHTTIRGYTVEKIIGVVRRFVSTEVGFNSDGKTNDCVIIFDYIKLPQTGASAGKEVKEYKILGMIADSLKMLAGDLGIPVITACQTNRAGDVANSYELTWFCDTFMELKNRPDKDIENERENGEYKGNQKLKIIANRGGEENHDGVYFDYMRNILSYVEVGIPKAPEYVK